ncbi:MAG: nodulation protein NfeD [Anaerolineales bacterium]|nr:nodulation protein NfeD [Anaerolineales bacterium]
MKRTVFLFFLLGVWMFLVGARAGYAVSNSIILLTIDGPITSATQTYLSRGLELAERRGAEVVILQLDTPGGSISSLQEMISSIRNSRVPVVVYVAPRGAWAASAGALLTLAGHASAMAPETAIGAASPVGGEGEDLGETMSAKVRNQMKAMISPLVAHRPQPAQEMAMKMIDEAEAVSSDEALKMGLIDFIAEDVPTLLQQLDGFVVQMPTGPRALKTQGLPVEQINFSLIEQILQILVNPNVVLILLGLGVQAILIELSSPGGWVAGFLGVVCLALAAYGLGFLSVNWFGLIFLGIAFVLFILDIKAGASGGLTAAGIGSFIVGALVLFNSPGTPEFQRVSIPLVVFLALAIGATFALIVGFAWRAQKTPIRTGIEGLIGAQGVVISDLHPVGQVQAAGELWTAEIAPGSDAIRKGERVEVVAVHGLRLQVKKVQENLLEPQQE